MIEIITTYSKPYYILLQTGGMAFTLAGGFSNKHAANKERSRWRRRWRRLPFEGKSEVLLLIKRFLREQP